MLGADVPPSCPGEAARPHGDVARSGTGSLRWDARGRSVRPGRPPRGGREGLVWARAAVLPGPPGGPVPEAVWGLGERPRTARESVAPALGGRKVARGDPRERGLVARDELVADRLVGLHSSVGVPPQAPGDEIEEGVVIALEHLLERL